MTNPTSNPTPDPIMPGYQYRRGFRPFAVQEAGVPAEGRQTSKAAFWSVVLGILPLVLGQLAPLALVVVPLAIVALTPLLALVGLPPAIVALGDIRRGARVGKGMAWTGIILNGIWIALMIGLAANG
jgi:hypothetical protein